MSLINNTSRAKQLIDFTGLEKGKKYPTDLDALMELNDKAYIFCEAKYMNNELPTGQRLALERLVNDTGRHKDSLLIVAEHNIANPNENVLLANCLVRSIYCKSKWYNYKHLDATVVQLIDQYLDSLKKKGVIL
jgi:hypothetical protein